MQLLNLSFVLSFARGFVFPCVLVSRGYDLLDGFGLELLARHRWLVLAAFVCVFDDVVWVRRGYRSLGSSRSRLSAASSLLLFRALTAAAGSSRFGFSGLTRGYLFGDLLVELDDQGEALFDEAQVLQQVAFADGLRAGNPVRFCLVAFDLAEEFLDESAA